MDLHYELDALLDTYPCEHTMNLDSQQKMQDFAVADFDRMLRVIQTRALIDIAESLVVMNLDRAATS